MKKGDKKKRKKNSILADFSLSAHISSPYIFTLWVETYKNKTVNGF